MTIENYIVLAMSGPMIVGGILIVRYRAKLHSVFSDVFRASFGAAGKQMAKRTSTFWVCVPGVGLILIGVCAFFMGIFARE